MSTSSILRVKSIQVDGLFDTFDHRVDLNLDERVTILHGPNGVGKTMLLRMTNAMLNGRYGLFREVPFSRFALEFTDDTCIELVVAPHDARKQKNSAPVLTLRLLRSGKHAESYKLPQHQAWSHSDLQKLRARAWNPSSLRFLAETLTERGLVTGGRRPSLEDVSANIANMRNLLGDSAEGEEPVWLSEARARVLVHVIEAQRLLRIAFDDLRNEASDPKTTLTVVNYARDMSALVKETMARYGQQSQSLDQSLPQRLLNARAAPFPREALKQRMRDLDTRRAELKEIGLLDESDNHPLDSGALDGLDEYQESVLNLYANDTEQKLSVLDDLARRTRLLLNNVNQKFQYKHIRIDPDRGIVAQGRKGERLELEQLSSGEQHELVLHYDLLFRVRPNTLVLIDEPELSLHVAWQKRFLPDLLEIVATAQFDVLMATHSPFIVGDRSDLMIGLGAEPA